MLKSLDIDIPQSEKRTLFAFLTLYAIMSIVILSFISYLYFTFKKDLMLQEKRIILQEYSNSFIFRLKDLHINFDKYKFYPRDEKFKSAIYDSDRKLIFSTITSSKAILDEVIYTTNEHIHFIEEPESYYLGAKYVLIEIEDNNKWLIEVRDKLIIFNVGGFIFSLFVGYFLLRLFLKPMRDSIELLDRFIKDTTHELNTPVSAILANIELIDKSKIDDDKFLRKIERIDTAAKTISNIYDDLTYLTLNNKIVSNNEDLDLSEIINNRVEYFQVLAKSKKIDFELFIEDSIRIYCDNKKISKLVDNLISNAIKYNKVNGNISITLKKDRLSIKDTGKGIPKDKLSSIFKRFERADNSVGGFGIGLNIVYMIANEYNLSINIMSKEKIGTEVIVLWED